MGKARRKIATTFGIVVAWRMASELQRERRRLAVAADGAGAGAGSRRRRRRDHTLPASTQAPATGAMAARATADGRSATRGAMFASPRRQRTLRLGLVVLAVVGLAATAAALVVPLAPASWLLAIGGLLLVALAWWASAQVGGPRASR